MVSGRSIRPRVLSGNTTPTRPPKGAFQRALSQAAPKAAADKLLHIPERAPEVKEAPFEECFSMFGEVVKRLQSLCVQELEPSPMERAVEDEPTNEQSILAGQESIVPLDSPT